MLLIWLQDAFILWDTYGFPLDLTQVFKKLICFVVCVQLCHYITSLLPDQLMAEERGLQVDVEGFNKAMDEARERSRNAQNKVFKSFLFYDTFISLLFLLLERSFSI